MEKFNFFSIYLCYYKNFCVKISSASHSNFNILKVRNMLKEIFKIIAFLSLSMCLMLNNNVVYAIKHSSCPAERESRNDVVPWKDWKKTDFYTKYVTHDVVEILADEDNKRSTAYAAACVTIATGIGTAAGGIPGGAIAGGLVAAIHAMTRTEGQKLLMASIENEYCGLKLHYWRDIWGQWHYYGFDPQ